MIDVLSKRPVSRRTNEQPQLRAFLEDKEHSLIVGLIARRSKLPRVEEGQQRHAGGHGTSVLVTSRDGTRESITTSRDLAALTSSPTLNTLDSISSSVGRRQLEHGYLLDVESDGVLTARRSVHFPMQLECSFYLLDCHLVFSDFEDWLTHSLDHFSRRVLNGPSKSVHPPTSVACCFCDKRFTHVDGRKAWRHRMVHVMNHHLLGHRVAHARPDFELYKYLWDNHIIEDAVYWEIKGNSEDRSQRIGGTISPPVSPVSPPPASAQEMAYTYTSDRRHDRRGSRA